MVDLETHQPVDLLDSRTSEAVSQWLQAHPGVEIVSRDRGTEYIKGVTAGVPDAVQVADRWHLLKNLRETVEAFLESNPRCLQAVANKSPDAPPTPSPPEEERPPITTMTSPQEKTPPVQPLTKAEQTKAFVHARRQTRYEQVHNLYQAGHSKRAISRQMKLSFRTITRYLAAENCPQYPTGCRRVSKLNRYLDYLQQRWQAGCTNATQLWRELVHQGFTGSRGLVSRWSIQERKLLPPQNRYSRQQPPERQPQLSTTQVAIPWSARRAAWLVVKNAETLEPDEKAALNQLKQTDEETTQVVNLAKQFVEMVKGRQENMLSGWIEEAIATGTRTLVGFATGLLQDLTAVRNALRYPWSSGRLKDR